MHQSKQNIEPSSLECPVSPVPQDNWFTCHDTENIKRDKLMQITCFQSQMLEFLVT
jgi:hypothetical protein